jgi:hypothetical protein
MFLYVALCIKSKGTIVLNELAVFTSYLNILISMVLPEDQGAYLIIPEDNSFTCTAVRISHLTVPASSAQH